MVFQWQSSVNLHNWNTLHDHSCHKYVYWDVTGTPLVGASPSGNPMLICIIGTHWNITGRHWLPTDLSPMAFQCTLGSKLRAHWIASGLPLNYHWLRVRDKTPIGIKIAWECTSTATPAPPQPHPTPRPKKFQLINNHNIIFGHFESCLCPYKIAGFAFFGSGIAITHR